MRRSLMAKATKILFVLTLVLALPPLARAQGAKTKLRIANSSYSVTSLPLLAARQWGYFQEQGLDVEIILMSPAISAPALMSGDLSYVAGVGPGSVSATLGGLPLRAVWFSSERVSYSLMTKPQYKTVQDLRGKKIGVTGSLGATNHVSLVIAMEKLGVNPKDYTMLSLSARDVVRSLETGFIDAASINPPAMFMAQKKGFPAILDIGSLVEMPGGGLTALQKDINENTDVTKGVIRALQMAKDEIRKSKPKTLALMKKLLKMDDETATATYDVFLRTLSVSGIPTMAGMDNLLKSVQSQGRFADRKVNFTDVADDRLAKEVAKELGYK